jgi:ATP-binding cassette subfamily F protein uup
VLLVSHDRDFLDRIVTSVIAAEGSGRWVEYAGGYADMMAQRGGDTRQLGFAQAQVEQRNAPQARRVTQPTEPTQRKLSFKEKHALETLPATIAKLEAEITVLQGKLADPGLYAKDPKAFSATSERLAAAEAELAAAETQWLELELKREELQS